jgi:hypothetical protein
MLPKAKVYPSSAQPTFKEFSNKYNYLSTHYESVIGVHISEAMSGTCSNSRKAAKTISNFTKKPIKVINSKRLSAGLGLIMMRAALAIENGSSYEQLTDSIEEWSGKTNMFVTTKTMKYMVKSGRVNAMKGLLGKILSLKPVIIVNDEGKTELIGKPRSEKASMKLTMKLIEKKIATQKLWGYAISHADNEDTANWYASKMKEITGQEPKFINYGSPVLGVNVGPGTVTLSMMFE